MSIYKVEGMTCGGCAASITRALQGAAASATIDVDFKSGTVSVEGIDAAKVQAIVEEAGFDFVGPAPA